MYSTQPPRIMMRSGHHQGPEEEATEVKCTGKHCRSCTGAVIADCVALCCCPCAVLNLLALAFIKVPWMVGRRLLKKRRKKQRCEVTGRCRSCQRMIDRDFSAGLGLGLEEVIRRQSFGGLGLEADKGGWLELYPVVGHLSFGRVSFTGVQFQPAKI